MIQIYCGDGKGKTTAAVGLAIRALGSGKKVLFVQFFKDGTSSEIPILQSLPNLTYLHTQKPFGRIARMTPQQVIQMQQQYSELLQTVIRQSEQFDLIVLDEGISAYRHEMFSKQALLVFMKALPNDKELVLTGRDPAEELSELADYISQVVKIKHPYDHGVCARKGIEY